MLSCSVPSNSNAQCFLGKARVVGRKSRADFSSHSLINKCIGCPLSGPVALLKINIRMLPTRKNLKNLNWAKTKPMESRPHSPFLSSWRNGDCGGVNERDCLHSALILGTYKQ